MMTTCGNHSCPVVKHLREAVERIRLANHALGNDCREVTTIADVFTVCQALVDELSHQVKHLWQVINRADATFYTTERGDSAEETLNSAEFAISEALDALMVTHRAARDTCTMITRLRIHGPA
jgi:hypothetical protein